MANKARLTDQQMRFVDEYLIDFNAVRAYMVAYPAVKKESTASAAASRLLKKPEVIAYLQKRQDALREENTVTIQKVIDELAAIAFADITDCVKVVKQPALNPITLAPIVDGEGNIIQGNVVSISETDSLTPKQKKAISMIKNGRNGIEVIPCDKIKALELLGKHLGLFDSAKATEKPSENNLFDAIAGKIKEDEFDDIPELQQETEADADVVAESEIPE